MDELAVADVDTDVADAGAVARKDAVGEAHRHPHEQVSYILSGSFQYEVEGKTYTLHKGDSYYVAPNELHGATALEDAVILDIFTPQREDFL